MSTPNKPPLLFEALSIELWERIFLLTSPQDILRLSSVNRACRELVQASPSIQYEIELFAVGLQRNPRIEAPIADRRQVLVEYLRRWETLEPVEKWTTTIRDSFWNPDIVAMSGVYGLHDNAWVKFFILGSTSRGIPGREWEIPTEGIEARDFAFYPQANVVVIAGNENREKPWEWKIRLRTLADGQPHPSAQIPTLSYTAEPELGDSLDWWAFSITGSRLAFFCRCSSAPEVTAQLAVWDWNTGEILLELKNEGYQFATFVDDFWLVILREGCVPQMPPAIILLHTKEGETAGGKPIQTTFHFDPSGHEGLRPEGLISDLGGHGHSCADDPVAPFYPDASQRLLVTEFSDHSLYVMKMEPLLRLAQERKGMDLRWEEWEDHVTWVRREARDDSIWVSGLRLCCVHPADSGKPRMDVYDFSVRAPAKDTETVKGRMIQRPAPSVSQILPWEVHRAIDADGCSDNITFLVNSEDPPGCTGHVWSFV